MRVNCLGSSSTPFEFFIENEGVLGGEFADSSIASPGIFDYDEENDVISAINDLPEVIQKEVNLWLDSHSRQGCLEPKELARLIKKIQLVPSMEVRRALLRSPFFQLRTTKDPAQLSREAVYLEFLVTESSALEEQKIEFLYFWAAIMHSEHADLFSAILDRFTPLQMMEFVNKLIPIMSEKEIGQFAIVFGSQIRTENEANFQEFIHLISSFYPKARKAVLDGMKWHADKVMTVQEFSSLCFSITPLSEQVLELFDEIGKINANEMALVIAAKQKEGKAHRQSIFVIEDLSAFCQALQRLAMNPTESKMICFQYVTRASHHSSFGEVIIDKSSEIPHLKIFMYDPAYPEYGFDQVVSELETMSSNDLKVTLIAPKKQERLQKGRGCSYFSLEGAFMLSNQREFENLYHRIEPSSSENFQMIKIHVPVRLKRSSHYLMNKDWDDKLWALGLYSSILNHPENSRKIVNHKGHTANQSVIKYLEEVSPGTIHNKRIDHKREGYQQDVREFMAQKEIVCFDGLLHAIRPFTQEGFYAYAEKLMNEAISA